MFIFVHSGLLLVILLGGAWYDIREQRIPNWWCMSALGAGFVLTWLGAGPREGVLQCLCYMARIGIVVTVWFPLFRLRMIGAGDVKLMALMAGYLGLWTGGFAILYGFFIGAILAFLKMLACRNLQQRLIYFFAYIRRLFLTREAVPYYQASRDGKGVVIPMGFCLPGGYVWQLLAGL